MCAGRNPAVKQRRARVENRFATIGQEILISGEDEREFFGRWREVIDCDLDLVAGRVQAIGHVHIAPGEVVVRADVGVDVRSFRGRHWIDGGDDAGDEAVVAGARREPRRFRDVTAAHTDGRQRNGADQGPAIRPDQTKAGVGVPELHRGPGDRRAAAILDLGEDAVLLAEIRILVTQIRSIRRKTIPMHPDAPADPHRLAGHASVRLAAQVRRANVANRRVLDIQIALAALHRDVERTGSGVSAPIGGHAAHSGGPARKPGAGRWQADERRRTRRIIRGRHGVVHHRIRQP